MSVKKIAIIVGAFLAVIAITIGVLVILKPQTKNQGVETSRGIKLTDNFEFNKLSNISGVPTFSSVPKAQSGWSVTTTSDELALGNASLSNQNGCMVSITSQLTPYTDKTLADFALTKAYVGTIASSEDGTLGDEYVIRLNSSDGEVDFYSGVYNPTAKLTHPTGTTATTTGGVEKLDGAYSTYLAVRSIASPISTGVKSATLPSDSKYKDGEIVKIADMIPTIVAKYTCKSEAFNAEEAAKFVKQITVDFKNIKKIESASSGK